MVAAKIDARINPPRKGFNCSIASFGNPVSAPDVPSSGSKTLQARPMRNMMAMNGVCQTKNQTIASFRALSSFNVITRDTTCGCPATPSPPRKNAAIQRVAPNINPEGKRLTMAGSIISNSLCRPENPPDPLIATKHRISEPTIMTQDCAASVHIEARIPPA